MWVIILLVFVYVIAWFMDKASEILDRVSNMEKMLKETRLMNMRIEYLCDFPEYVNTVSGWIYYKFVDKSKSNLTKDEVVSYFSNTSSKSFPITFIAIINGKCVGTVSIFENDLKTQNELKPWLASLFIEPSFRRGGIAELLINRVLLEVKKLGFDKVYLRTEHASEYYEKRGWEFVFKAQDNYGQKTAVFMHKI